MNTFAIVFDLHNRYHNFALNFLLMGTKKDWVVLVGTKMGISANIYLSHSGKNETLPYIFMTAATFYVTNISLFFGLVKDISNQCDQLFRNITSW